MLFFYNKYDDGSVTVYSDGEWQGKGLTYVVGGRLLLFPEVAEFSASKAAFIRKEKEGMPLPNHIVEQILEKI